MLNGQIVPALSQWQAFWLIALAVVVSYALRGFKGHGKAWRDVAR